MWNRLTGYQDTSSHPGVSIFNGEIRPGRALRTNIYPASFEIRFFRWKVIRMRIITEFMPGGLC